VTALRVWLTVFAAAFAADLLTKQWAVSHADVVVFNNRPSQLPLRLSMSIAAIVVAWLLAWLASFRGLGRQWGLWAGCGLLVAGVLGNGISSLLWRRGIPDFISVGGGWAWNLADFEIALGMTGGLLSVIVSAFVLYGREKMS